MTGLAIAALSVLAFWTAFLLDRKRAWPGACFLRTAPPAPKAPAGSVAVVVPARDEARAIAVTLPTLLMQGDSVARLVVVDDRSTDGTGEIATRLARRSQLADRVRIISPGPPPPGWTGKVHALASGYRSLEDLPDRGPLRYVLFADADIRHPSGSIDALYREAEEGPFQLVSVMARLHSVAFWEKVLVPPFVYFFQILYPFRRVSDPHSRVAAAAGGCMLIRESMLRQIGGLSAIRAATIDDLALARCVKAAGGRCWLGFHPEIVSVRSYDGLAGIVNMVARSAFTQLRFRYSGLLVTIAALALLFVSPPLLLLAGVLARDPVCWGPAAVAWAIQSWTILPVVRYHTVPAAYAVTLPLGALLYAGMTLLSAWRHATGRKTLWKGRGVG